MARAALVLLGQVQQGLGLQEGVLPQAVTGNIEELKGFPLSSPSPGQAPLYSPQVPPPQSPPPRARLAWLWNERYAVKQDRPTLSLAPGGRVWGKAGWVGTGPRSSVSEPTTTGMSWVCKLSQEPALPLGGGPSPGEDRGGGGHRKTKGGKGGGLGGNQVGGLPGVENSTC